MQEFDQCPNCQEDLLLAHSKEDVNELSCLGCGYVCQATGDSPDPSLAAQADTDQNYWKLRCEAAENILEAINLNDDEMHAKAYRAWLELKENEELA